MKKNIKSKVKKKNVKIATFNLIEVIIIILMTSVIVGISTGIIVYKNYSKIEDNYSLDEVEYFQEFKKAYNKLINSYIGEISEKELVNAAIEGMYNYLGDPYTGFIDSENSSDLTDRLNGEYKGIGVEIYKIKEGIYISNVFENGPAHKAGLKKGDIITKVGDKDIIDRTAAEVSDMIKKSKENTIILEIIRENETKGIEVDISNVYVPSVESENINGTGYLKITTFSNTTLEQFKKALAKLEKEKIDGLVIDLRDNGGGFLQVAAEIAELFIEKGKTIYGLESKSKTTYYEDSTLAKRDYKISVIINSASASASEILTAALKESYGATIVGSLSYGKGTVQETAMLESGGMIKYTTAYWLTPTGKKIDGIGIKPDIEVNSNAGTDNSISTDQHIKAAINAVK